MSSEDVEYWIYHERQQALLCGQHALNNLVQANKFSPGQLAEIAHQLDQMELNFMAQNNEGGIQ
jgi:ataxin-3